MNSAQSWPLGVQAHASGSSYTTQQHGVGLGRGNGGGGHSRRSVHSSANVPKPSKGRTPKPGVPPPLWLPGQTLVLTPTEPLFSYL